MFIDFTKGFGGEPDFNWRAYAEYLLQAFNDKTGQAWILEQEVLRLRAGIATFSCDCTDRCKRRNSWQDVETCLKFRATRLLQPAKETP